MECQDADVTEDLPLKEIDESYRVKNEPGPSTKIYLLNQNEDNSTAVTTRPAFHEDAKSTTFPGLNLLMTPENLQAKETEQAGKEKELASGSDDQARKGPPLTLLPQERGTHNNRDNARSNKHNQDKGSTPTSAGNISSKGKPGSSLLPHRKQVQQTRPRAGQNWDERRRHLANRLYNNGRYSKYRPQLSQNLLPYTTTPKMNRIEVLRMIANSYEPKKTQKPPSASTGKNTPDAEHNRSSQNNLQHAHQKRQENRRDDTTNRHHDRGSNWSRKSQEHSRGNGRSQRHGDAEKSGSSTNFGRSREITKKENRRSGKTDTQGRIPELSRTSSTNRARKDSAPVVRTQRTRANTEIRTQRTSSDTDIRTHRTRPDTDIRTQRTKPDADIRTQRTRPDTDVRTQRTRPDVSVRTQRTRSDSNVRTQRIRPDSTGGRKPQHTARRDKNAPGVPKRGQAGHPHGQDNHKANINLRPRAERTKSSSTAKPRPSSRTRSTTEQSSSSERTTSSAHTTSTSTTSTTTTTSTSTTTTTTSQKATPERSDSRIYQVRAHRNSAAESRPRRTESRQEASIIRFDIPSTGNHKNKRQDPHRHPIDQRRGQRGPHGESSVYSNRSPPGHHQSTRYKGRNGPSRTTSSVTWFTPKTSTVIPAKRWEGRHEKSANQLENIRPTFPPRQVVDQSVVGRTRSPPPSQVTTNRNRIPMQFDNFPKIYRPRPVDQRHGSSTDTSKTNRTKVNGQHRKNSTMSPYDILLEEEKIATHFTDISISLGEKLSTFSSKNTPFFSRDEI